MAKKDDCDSIAFPAIGTGQLGFSETEVAQIMTEAVKDFSRTYNGRPMAVYFVIYPSQNGTYQVWRADYAKQVQTKAGRKALWRSFTWLFNTFSLAHAKTLEYLTLAQGFKVILFQGPHTVTLTCNIIVKYTKVLLHIGIPLLVSLLKVYVRSFVRRIACKCRAKKANLKFQTPAGTLQRFFSFFPTFLSKSEAG